MTLLTIIKYCIIAFIIYCIIMFILYFILTRDNEYYRQKADKYNKSIEKNQGYNSIYDPFDTTKTVHREIINNNMPLKNDLIHHELKKENKYIHEIQKTFIITLDPKDWSIYENYKLRIIYQFDKNFNIVHTEEYIKELDYPKLLNKYEKFKISFNLEECILKLLCNNNILCDNNNMYTMFNDEITINLLDIKSKDKDLNYCIKRYKQVNKRYTLKATIKNKYNYMFIDDL